MQLLDILVGAYGLDYKFPESREYDERLFNFTETGYVFDNIAKNSNDRSISYEIISEPKKVNTPISLKVSLNRNHNNMESMLLNSRTFVDANSNNVNGIAYSVGNDNLTCHPVGVIVDIRDNDLGLYPTNMCAIEVEIPDRIINTKDADGIDVFHEKEYNCTVLLTVFPEFTPPDYSFEHLFDMINFKSRVDLDIADITKFKNIEGFDTMAKIIYASTYSLVDPKDLI